jgi:plasmid stabilization system protein ParE
VTTSLHREADSDLTAAFRHYKQEAGTGVAGRFLKEFRRVTEVLERDPGLGTPTSEGRRSFPLVGFPYSLIYREVDAGLRILVVRHQSRDPEYGTDRS